MGNPIPILTLHHIYPGSDRLAVPPDLFKDLLSKLLERRRFISYNQFKAYLLQEEAVPKGCVLLTLDDGYLDNYLYAFPILQELAVPAVMFVVTGLIGESSQCRRTMSPVGHRELWKNPTREHFINTAELKQMHQSGLVDFSSHTETHRKCVNREAGDLLQEFNNAYGFIRDMGCEDAPHGFCWPGGQFDGTALASIRQSPYRLAFSTIDGGWRRQDDPYTIRRIDCSSFSGSRRDYFFRVWKKLLIYSNPIFGHYYSAFKRFRQERRNK